MRRVLLTLLFAGLAVPAYASPIVWSATLDSIQEIPPTLSPGSGFGTVTFDDSTNVLDLYLEWQNLTGPGVQAHIHCCVASPPGNVGIALDLWLAATPQPPAGVYTASYDLDLVNPFRAAFVAANGGTALTAAAALRTAMDLGQGRAYFNIHTAIFSGGEIRGNLAAVPEPGTFGLAMLGLAALALRKRIRVRV
jgi:hypothetical protein